MDGLLRLVRPFIVACMGCLVVSMVCSVSLARSAVFSKHVVMSGCFVDERSCSGLGPGGRVARVIAKSSSHRVAQMWLGGWFGEYECEGKKVFEGVCLRQPTEIEDCFLESVGDYISKVGACP